MAESGNRWSRRRFLFLGAGSVVVIGLAGAWQRWRTIGALGHAPDVPGEALVSPEVSSTLTSFLGAAFGVRLAQADIQDLQSRLSYAAEHDGAWAREYLWLADYVNQLAMESGADSFAGSELGLREALVRQTLQFDADNRTQRIRAFFDPDGRNVLRMRKSTIPHLFRLFRMSGVPWRQRGYVSWPGLPDDRLAYTRALPARRCE